VICSQNVDSPQKDASRKWIATTTATTTIARRRDILDSESARSKQEHDMTDQEGGETAIAAMVVPHETPEVTSEMDPLPTSVGQPIQKPFAWGRKSSNSDVTGTSSTTPVKKATSLAAIMAEETETRQAAQAVYHEESKTLMEIEAEQSRLWKDCCGSSNRKEEEDDGFALDGWIHVEQPNLPPSKDRKDDTIVQEGSTSELPSDIQQQSQTQTSILDTLLTAEERNHLSAQEIEEIERALRGEDGSQPLTESNQSDPPTLDSWTKVPTSLPAVLAAETSTSSASASNLSGSSDFISPEEAAAIEAALRDADAQEEHASFLLALAMQQEEHQLVMEDEAVPQRRRGPQGNVRIMTRAELELESNGLSDHPDQTMMMNTMFESRPHPTVFSSMQDDDYNDETAGFRMNSTSQQEWARKDRNTIVGPNNEIRTKHDVHVQGQANAQYLGLDEDGFGFRTHVGNHAFNSFKKDLKQMRKGVASHGTGRAGTDSEAVKGKAMDPHVRLHISRAINSGLIEGCNGEVKQGKEAVVYHAEKGAQSHGHDVAVKVFKRITEFKGRGAYVDGDPRYVGQPFRKNSEREQLEIWAEKEYRNLIRANRSHVPVPTPLDCKENIIFMRFMGTDGWPAPQIREVKLRNGSKKWDILYTQCMEAIRR